MNIFHLFLLLLCGLHPVNVHSVMKGDEKFGDMSGGRFWAFHSAGASIVNPDTCRVENNFRHDHTGGSLPDSWNDGVYMESDDGNGYVFMISGVTEFDADDQASDDVLIFSTNPSDYSAGPVQMRITIGTSGGGGGRRGLSSAYGVYTRNEFWTQARGHFYVISLAELEESGGPLTVDKMFVHDLEFQDGDDVLDGGRLLWDESKHLSNHGYVTAHRGKTIYVVDLQQHKRVSAFNYSQYVEDDECHGTWGIAFSNVNKHLFLTCRWDGPILELDVAVATQPQFVAKHANTSGWLYEEDKHGIVVATDRHRNLLHIFQPDMSGRVSSKDVQVSVPGHPDLASFYERGPDDTVACMPLTESTNKNNMDSTGRVVCDQYSCGPPQSPADVAAGMCLYDDTNKTLLRAPLADFDKVVNGEPPYNNRCPRCKKQESYRGGDICTCTPHCGSCGTPNYDARLSGVRCLSLQEASSSVGVKEAILIAGAGAVAQSEPSFWSPQCSYGWTHRSSKRGGKYHASVAHYPSNSLQIVDMSTIKLACQVDLPGRPDRVLYVPPQPGQELSHQASTSYVGGTESKRAQIVIVALGSVVALFLVMTVVSASSTARQLTDRPMTHQEIAASGDLELTEQPSSEPLPEIS